MKKATLCQRCHHCILPFTVFRVIPGIMLAYAQALSSNLPPKPQIYPFPHDKMFYFPMIRCSERVSNPKLHSLLVAGARLRAFPKKPVSNFKPPTP